MQLVKVKFDGRVFAFGVGDDLDDVKSMAHFRRGVSFDLLSLNPDSVYFSNTVPAPDRDGLIDGGFLYKVHFNGGRVGYFVAGDDRDLKLMPHFSDVKSFEQVTKNPDSVYLSRSVVKLFQARRALLI
jgi:hypothetical protein